MTTGCTTQDAEPEHELRAHASRAALYWLLGELLDSPLRTVDVEYLRALLETTDPPPPLEPAWRDVRYAVAHVTDPSFERVRTHAAVPVLPRSWSRDLRVLARATDEWAQALAAGDSADLARARRRHAQALEQGVVNRLSSVAGELQRGGSVYASLGRALRLVLSQDASLDARRTLQAA